MEFTVGWHECCDPTATPLGAWGCSVIFIVRPRHGGSVKHLDLNHAPYVLYGVEYIDLVSLALFSGRESSMSLAP